MNLWIRNLGRTWLSVLLHVCWLESFTQLLSAGGWAGLENSKRLHSHSVHSYCDTSLLLHLASHSVKLRLPYSMANSEYLDFYIATGFQEGTFQEGQKQKPQIS